MSCNGYLRGSIGAAAVRRIILNAETQRNAEKRREEELSAKLCESLRLGVKG